MTKRLPAWSLMAGHKEAISVKRRTLDGIDERAAGHRGDSGPETSSADAQARESMSVEGVINVESFDSQEVLLETDQGMMIVRGDDLHIKELNLEGGNLWSTASCGASSTQATAHAKGGRRRGCSARFSNKRSSAPRDAHITGPFISW